MRESLRWLWIPALCAWVWWCSMQAVASARIAELRCIENYAFAVYEQLIANHARSGSWSQTIHFGYLDHWMWSGHRSLWLWGASSVYGLWPEALTLARFQLGMVSLGVFPAFGLGMRAVGGVAGGMVGILLYLGFGPLWLVALNDYQDIIVGISFGMGAIWASRIEKPLLFVPLAVGAMAAREEWAAVMVLAGLGMSGSLKERGKWVGLGLVVALLYGALIVYLGRDFKGHDNQMAVQAGGLLQGIAPMQRTWADFERFYIFFLFPLHFLALLSPGTLFPLAGVLFFHLTAPPFGGVDTKWDGHIHHLSPALPFLCAGAIEGVGKLKGLLSKIRGKAGAFMGGAGGGWLALVLVGAVTISSAQLWVKFLKAELELWPVRAGEWAPEWELVKQVPVEAPIATDLKGSLLVSGRPLSFTYEESLEDKRPGQGLKAVEYFLAPKREREWVAKARAEGGIEEGETAEYLLFHFVREP